MIEPQKSTFFEHLPPNFSLQGGILEDRLLPEYGAMFVAKGVALPERLAFTGHPEVERFQEAAGSQAAILGNHTIELQPAAMNLCWRR
ncbi:MAG: hypothetical protein QUS14_16730 [Pyrinomonadaceae bacterium]|nr:hypothetical protein [Pyrinomonadaceae bacterium]